MKNNIITLGISAVLALSLTACGGGGGSDSSTGGDTSQPPVVVDPNPSEPLVNTVDLEVSQDFDFRTDMDITLAISETPVDRGIINVYHDFEFHDEANDTYIPDMKTRIISFYPQATDSIDVQVSKNWNYLIVEFIPTTATGFEKYKKIDLSNDEYVSFSFND